MATVRSSKKIHWVVCYDYAFGPFDLTTAYNLCEQANEHDPKRSGIDCQYHHKMVTSPTKPMAGYELYLDVVDIINGD